MAELELALLPQYTPSEPSPAYSCKPSSDERTLQETPRRIRTTPTGTYTQRSGKFTVSLFEQENDIDIPIYGSNGEISGSIFIEEPQTVSRVTLKIEGKLDTKIPVSGSMTIPLLSWSCTLWRKGDADTLSNYLPFSHLLSPIFIYEGSEHNLPPTYSVRQVGFCLRAMYSIIVCVRRARHVMDILTRSDRVKIPFKYHPRVRPRRPILMNFSFFSTVKTSPEEWYQTSSAMKMRRNTPELGTVHCDFFIPGGRVYGLADRIPFHVQLNGRLDALQSFLPQPIDASLIPSHSHTKSPQQKFQPKIKVSLMRQSKIETRHEKSFNNASIGEGEIWELPPGICKLSDVIHLNWEGNAKLNPDVTVGGFITGNVSVRDFIVLTLELPPVHNEVSLFQPLQITVPIRLVTDSFAEVFDYEPPPL